MRFETKDKIEEFFVDGVNVGTVFHLVERTDYYFLYRIIHSHNTFDDNRSMYLSDLADELEMKVPDLSKVMHALEEKGFVTWHTDDKKERTYVTLTGKAVDLMGRQKQLMIECYKRLTEVIPGDELAAALGTMEKIRNVISEVKLQ